MVNYFCESSILPRYLYEGNSCENDYNFWLTKSLLNRFHDIKQIRKEKESYALLLSNFRSNGAPSVCSEQLFKRFNTLGRVSSRLNLNYIDVITESFKNSNLKRTSAIAVSTDYNDKTQERMNLKKDEITEDFGIEKLRYLSSGSLTITKVIHGSNNNRTPTSTVENQTEEISIFKVPKSLKHKKVSVNSHKLAAQSADLLTSKLPVKNGQIKCRDINSLKIKSNETETIDTTADLSLKLHNLTINQAQSTTKVLESDSSSDLLRSESTSTNTTNATQKHLDLSPTRDLRENVSEEISKENIPTQKSPTCSTNERNTSNTIVCDTNKNESNENLSSTVNTPNCEPRDTSPPIKQENNIIFDLNEEDLYKRNNEKNNNSSPEETKTGESLQGQTQFPTTDKSVSNDSPTESKVNNPKSGETTISCAVPKHKAAPRIPLPVPIIISLDISAINEKNILIPTIESTANSTIVREKIIELSGKLQIQPSLVINDKTTEHPKNNTNNHTIRSDEIKIEKTELNGKPVSTRSKNKSKLEAPTIENLKSQQLEENESSNRQSDDNKSASKERTTRNSQSKISKTSLRSYVKPKVLRATIASIDCGKKGKLKQKSNSGADCNFKSPSDSPIKYDENHKRQIFTDRCGTSPAAKLPKRSKSYGKSLTNYEPPVTRLRAKQSLNRF